MRKPDRTQAKRELVCAEALAWIRGVGTFPSESIILTSLPDISEVVEFAPRFEDWEAFFMDAVHSILEAKALYSFLAYGSNFAFRSR